MMNSGITKPPCSSHRVCSPPRLYIICLFCGFIVCLCFSAFYPKKNNGLAELHFYIPHASYPVPVKGLCGDSALTAASSPPSRCTLLMSVKLTQIFTSLGSPALNQRLSASTVNMRLFKAIWVPMYRNTTHKTMLKSSVSGSLQNVVVRILYVVGMAHFVLSA